VEVEVTTDRAAYVRHWDAMVPRYAQCVTCSRTRETAGGLARLSVDGWTFELRVQGLAFRCAECSAAAAHRDASEKRRMAAR
jgi:hypothetical protein